MKPTRHSNQPKQNGAKQQNAARQNLESFGDVDAPESVATKDEDTVDGSAAIRNDARSPQGVAPREKPTAVDSDDTKITSSFSDFESSVEMFAGGIAKNAFSQAKETVVQAKDTVNQMRETVAQARETLSQAKVTMEAVKETARQVLIHMRKNPEPFIAAAIPGLIGIYLLVQRLRKPSLTSS